MNTQQSSPTGTVSRVLGATGLAIFFDLLIGMHLYGSNAAELVDEKRDYLMATIPFFVVLLNAMFYLMEKNSDLRRELDAAQSKKDVAVVLDTPPDLYITTMREYQTNIVRGEQVNENIMSLARYIHTYLTNYPDRVRDVVPFLIFLAGTQKIKKLDELVASLTVYLKGITVGLERIDRYQSEVVKRNGKFHECIDLARFDLR